MSRTPRAPRITVDVTENIIEDSTGRDSSHCMIAQAVKEAVPEARHVAVDLQTIRFSDPKKGLRYTYLTPRVGQVALVDFDQGRLPEPFSMQLRGGQVTNAGAQRERKQLSPAEKKQRVEAAQKAQERLKKTRLKNRVGEAAGKVPDRVGGKTPPRMPWGRRRAFGLRGLER